jgi:hypothetical protein
MKDKLSYSDNLTKAAEFLLLTLSLLSKHKIPANPHFYQMGYEYVSGRNQSLIDDLNKLIDSSQVLEETQLQELYYDYFLQDEEFLGAIRQELRHIISKLLEEFVYSANQLSSYTETLHQFIDILDSDNSSIYVES